MDLPRIQSTLRDAGIEAWLLYDFQGTNRISSRVAGVPSPLSRRWFSLVPAAGEPIWVLHRIELGPFASVPGKKLVYLAREELESRLREALAGLSRVAMEYSPRAALPTASRVDAGTVELVRSMGVEVVTSAALAQVFFAPWGEEGEASHRRASVALSKAKELGLETVRASLSRGRRPLETEVQAAIAGEIERGGLSFDHPPIVAVGPHAGDPHFSPSPEGDARIGPDEVLLIDLWGKESGEAAIYADMTWMAYTGKRVPAAVQRVWETVRRARDAVVEELVRRHAAGETARGFELDRVARGVIREAGYGDAFLHRTGHSIGRELHGDGANLDSLETLDERPILAGTGFSVEPGIYLDAFGVRSEIDVFLGSNGPVVTTERQMDLTLLG
ncbi:MAG: aminopeptidase P family protein [Planctomycetes bacterium]|nr:aminopeptidase P family protein [Planctomycetota bacterium]